ncbi:hypothetical protein EV132_101220 [Rhizobium sullae]|uniref:Uncharacterized protein n=1 Tax=Rhizobium sullae TaxID=50338 RepID=A0A4R3QP59_RHISU|nr:hypothetical protein EV132_101220 [Rhizobium sullae]
MLKARIKNPVATCLMPNRRLSEEALGVHEPLIVNVAFGYSAGVGL